MPKKPGRSHYFFASNWPGRIWITVFPLASAIVVGKACASFLDPGSSIRELARFIAYVGVGALLGLFLAAFPGWLIIGPLLYDRELKNGGPFQPGDSVLILSGPYKGQVATVYARWQGDNLRVDLGQARRETYTDIFAPAQLWRMETPDTQPPVGPN